MRLPVVTEIESRDGTSNQDERLTNALMEIEDQDAYGCIRPGLVTAATSSGNGNGLSIIDGVLISVFGTTLGRGTGPTTIDTVLDGAYDFAQGPL